jgi:hypothetical protein
MSDYPDEGNESNQLPAQDLCNVSEGGKGALGNEKTGKMYHQGGDKKRLVEIAQMMLKEQGHDLGTSGPEGDGVDGNFGDSTEKAVKQFQEEHKDWDGNALKVDGLVGPDTADALNREMVGKWYRHYQTKEELVKGAQYHTVTSEFLDHGLTVNRGQANQAKIFLAERIAETKDQGDVSECGTQVTYVQSDEHSDKVPNPMEQSRSDIWGYKYPKKSNGTKKIVHCRILYAKNISAYSLNELCSNYGRTAKAILRKHNLGFAMSVDDAPIDFDRLININNIDDYRTDVEEIRSGIDFRWSLMPLIPTDGTIIPIVIVVCRDLDPPNRKDAEKWIGKFQEYPQLPYSPDVSRNFIMLDAKCPNRTDWATLIHEVGHAAGMDWHFFVGINPSSPFDIMCSRDPIENPNFPKDGIRDGMLKRTVDKIGGAIFSW